MRCKQGKCVSKTAETRIPGTCEEVSSILGEALDLPRWWPAVYLDVRELEPGDETGVGKVIAMTMMTTSLLQMWNSHCRNSAARRLINMRGRKISK